MRIEPVLSRQSILRVTASLVAAERARSGTGRAWDCTEWSEATGFGSAGLALDSLELWACASEVSRFFRLHEAGRDSRLLHASTLGDWCDIIADALALSAEGLTFATSGTSGLPKLCRQTMAALHREAGFWHTQFTPRARVVLTVPSHHIYGFLFAVLLPQIASWPVLDIRSVPPGSLRHHLRPRDLLVGFPAQLERMSRLATDLPADLQIVSATSKLEDDTYAALYRLGAAGVTDIYGSSETGGIALRHGPAHAFALLPWWDPAQDGSAVTDRTTGETVRLPDRVTWDNEITLRPADRIDGAVQVAGVNVYPERIAALLRSHAPILDCEIWLDAALPEPRLRALVVPQPGCGEHTALAACEAWTRKRLSAPERPISFAVKPARSDPTPAA